MYSLETYKADKAAIDAAKVELNRLVIGEPSGACAIWQGEYARIASYFGHKDAILNITHYGDTVRRVARMFMAISTANRISGFDCNIYQAVLTEVEKKIKSMRIFKRRAKIKCFQPKLHRQPCYCARLQAVEAVQSIAQADIQPDLKEELQAKVNGALILDKEFRDEE